MKGASNRLSGTSGGLSGSSSGSGAGTTAGGYTTSGSGTGTLAPIFGGGGPGGGFAGPGGFGGFGGPGGAGGPGGPSIFAFGLPRGPGSVDAFTAAVASLAGCFYALTPFEQQVLIVRTGLDGRQPLTRNQLAALLGTTPGTIGRSERGALRELRQAARSDGCMPVAAAAFGSPLTAFVGGPFGPVGFATPGIPPTSRIAPGAGGAGQPQLASTSFAERLGTFDGNGRADPFWAVILVALLLLTAIGALGREVRHSVT